MASLLLFLFAAFLPAGAIDISLTPLACSPLTCASQLSFSVLSTRFVVLGFGCLADTVLFALFVLFLAFAPV